MSILQWDRDFALDQAAEDEELLQELIDIFKSSFSDDLQSLKEGIAASDCEQVASAAHSIKGASSSLGILGITQIVKQIEEESKAGSLESATEKLPQLEQMLVEVSAL